MAERMMKCYLKYIDHKYGVNSPVQFMDFLTREIPLLNGSAPVRLRSLSSI